jgi:hypothetical protein
MGRRAVTLLLRSPVMRQTTDNQLDAEDDVFIGVSTCQRVLCNTARYVSCFERTEYPIHSPTCSVNPTPTIPPLLDQQYTQTH